MIWCGKLALAGLLAAPPADVPVAVAMLVRDAIGRTWKVSPAQVQLEWGPLGSRQPLADSAAVRILGQGRDGRFVVGLMTRNGGMTALSLRAGVADTVWVAGRSLPAGTRIGPDEARREVRVVWGPPPIGGRPAPLGAETRRNLAEGDRLEPPSIEEAPIIVPGDRVRFVWERDGLRIVREAVAGTRARRGERVFGRDEARHEQLAGIAEGPGLARLERKEVP